MIRSLSDWASVAQIFSGVAVVVTLIYLIIGIRENTDVLRASAYDRDLQSLIDWRSAIVQDPDSMRVIDKFFAQSPIDTAGLSSEDRTRLRMIVDALWLSYEKSYFAKEYGLLAEAEWNRFVKRMCANYTRDVSYRNESVANFLSDEFAAYVVASCAKRP